MPIKYHLRGMVRAFILSLLAAAGCASTHHGSAYKSVVDCGGVHFSYSVSMDKEDAVYVVLLPGENSKLTPDIAYSIKEYKNREPMYAFKKPVCALSKTLRLDN